MVEEWRPVKGYEGLYEVSNLGQVKSKRRSGTPDRILKPSPAKNGYLHVGLSKNGIHATTRIHRLVTETFIPNPDKKPQVNHKDGVKTNNVVTNLEWCTSSENIIHAFRTGLNIPPRGERSHTAKLVASQVTALFEDTRDFEVIAKEYGVHTQTVKDIKAKRSWRHLHELESLQSQGGKNE